MNDDLSNLLEKLGKSVSFSKETRIQKIIKKPKLLYSKILEVTAFTFKNHIKIKTRTFWGGEMLVVFPELVSLNIYKYGFFEEGLTRMLIEYLKPGMTFFDIGAHFGYYALLGSYLVGENGQVHAFEPTPSTFNILQINTSNYPNIKINNCALSSEDGIALINDFGIKYSAFNSIFKPRLPQDVINKITPKKHEIKIITVDDYVNKTKSNPGFIKIDAESAEYEILLGMREAISKFHPIITIEVGDYGVEGVPPCKEIIKYLIDFNYKPYEYSKDQITPHKIKESYEYDNILFLPQNK